MSKIVIHKCLKIKFWKTIEKLLADPIVLEFSLVFQLSFQKFYFKRLENFKLFD